MLHLILYFPRNLILVFWTSRSLHLNNSRIWINFYNNFWYFTKNNLWDTINDLCHVFYFSFRISCMGPSYVYYRFRIWRWPQTKEFSLGSAAIFMEKRIRIDGCWILMNRKVQNPEIIESVPASEIDSERFGQNSTLDGVSRFWIKKAFKW